MKIDWPSLLAGLRTAGALLIGNSLVVPVLRDFEPSAWWVLLLVGAGLIIVTSLKGKKS